MGSRVKRQEITLKVPGTSANLGPGFDTLGIAINLYLNLSAKISNKFLVEFSGEGEEQIEKGINNLIIKSYKRYFHKVKEPIIPIELSIDNEIPLKRGLGSSASAIVGGLLLAQRMAKKKISEQELLNMATSIEGHPDNVAPALLGGMTACCVVKNKVIVSSVKIPKKIKLTAIIPNLTISTKEARNILPQSIPFKDAVFNVQRAVLLVNSFNSSELENIHYFFSDKLHQDYRKGFIPGFDEAVKKGLESGAIGVYLSGSGPTIMAVCLNKGINVARAIGKVFEMKNIKSRIKYLEPVLNV